MQKVTKFDTVGTIWKIADTAIEIDDGISGVAVETTDVDGSFDGTIVYFPGLKANDLGEILADQEEEEEVFAEAERVYKIGEVFYNMTTDDEVLLAQVGFDKFALISLANGNRVTEPYEFPQGAQNGLTETQFKTLCGSFHIEPYQEEL